MNITKIFNEVIKTIMVLTVISLIAAIIIFIAAQFSSVEASERVSQPTGTIIARRPLTAPQVPVGPKPNSTVTIGRISGLQSADSSSIRLRTYETRHKIITTGRVGDNQIRLETKKDD